MARILVFLLVLLLAPPAFAQHAGGGGGSSGQTPMFPDAFNASLPAAQANLLSLSDTSNTRGGTSSLLSWTVGGGVDNTAFGFSSLKNTTTGFENTAVGENALFANISNQSSTGVGSNALYNTAADFNTGVGSNAGRAWSSGGGNTALGHGAAGQDDTSPSLATGFYNTAIGGWSLQEITTGGGNTGVGMNSLLDITTGQQNTAVGLGANAGGSGSTGVATGNAASFNVAVGYDALQNNQANNLVAVGFNALKANTTGTTSVAVGSQALLTTMADSDNTAVGASSLYTLNGGTDNTALGYNTLNLCSTCSQDVALGSGAFATGNYSNSIAIGYGAQPTASNQIWIGNSSTATGVFQGNLALPASGFLGFTGSTAPGSSNFALYGQSNITALNAPTSSGTLNFDINNISVAQVSGSLSEFKVLYSTASTSTTSGSLVTAGGLGVGLAAYIGGAIVNSGIVADTGQADRTVCEDTTNHQFYSGTGTAGICLGTSSARFKNRIRGLAQGLWDVLLLKPVQHHYNPGLGMDTDKRYFGFLAEDVEKVLPDLVGKDKAGKVLSVDYVGIIPVIVNAVKMLAYNVGALWLAIVGLIELGIVQHRRLRRVELALAAQ